MFNFATSITTATSAAIETHTHISVLYKPEPLKKKKPTFTVVGKKAFRLLNVVAHLRKKTHAKLDWIQQTEVLLVPQNCNKHKHLTNHMLLLH